jgi:ferritin-like metal-binding protein YciE
MTGFDEQLNKYLTDAHSIEKQALIQMKAAPKIAGDPAIELAFAEHLTETEGHESLVRARLEARDASPSLLKDTAGAMEEHLVQTREHQRLIEQRLEARGASPSKLKDAAMRLGALNWGGFFGVQPDTSAKLAGFAYAFEHLEIGAYELLRRVAQRAGDSETVAVAEHILTEEREAAQKLHSLFDAAVDAALEAQGVGAR